MPHKCCVPCCRSNYDKGDYVTVFKFPKDEAMKENWLKCIHRASYTVTTYSRVCINHFDEKFIVKEDAVERADGSVLVAPRTILKLTEDAFPTIFPNQPSYMSLRLPKKRKDPEIRHVETEKRLKVQAEQEAEHDKITDFNIFKTMVIEKCEEFKKELDIKIFEKHVYFYKLLKGESDKPVIISLCVKDDFSLKIFTGENHKDALLLTKIKEIISTKECCNWSSLTKILGIINSYELEFDSSQFTYEDNLKTVSDLLKAATQDKGISTEKLHKINFLMEQLNLIVMKQRRYSPDTLIWASSMYFMYPGAYQFLEKSNCLTVPHPKYLKSLIMKLDIENSGLNIKHVKYLQEKLKLLNQNEKIVTLMLDEIYVKSTVSYKGGKIEGIDLTSSEKRKTPVPASTIQTFMIRSILSHNRDVVGLFPVSSLKAEFLYKLTLQVLKMLTECGYQVVCIVSDNNNVNRKMFEILCGGTLKLFITNPYSDIEQKIFILFDSVHLFKVIRNIWLNQKDPRQTLVIPEIPNNFTEKQCKFQSEVKSYACVADLKNLLHHEENQILKLAPSLNRKVLFPTSIERQNVSLCVRFFDEKNIAALQIINSNNVESVNGTCSFLKLVSDWWKIANCNSLYKGVRFRDSHYEPIKSISNDDNLTFLENFVHWLNIWNTLEIQGESENSRHGKLTKQTQIALTHTTSCFIELSKYLLSELNFEYVLLSRFQTDYLEGRFGQYRQMSGGNYHISVVQVLESERKLKLIGLLKLKSAKNGEFFLQNFLDMCDDDMQYKDEIDNIEHFEDALILTENENTISKEESEILVYIGGYIVNRICKTLQCNECRHLICFDKNLEVDTTSDINSYQYLKLLDRGGLKVPKEIFVNVITYMFILFKVLISDQFEEAFLKCKNQRRILKKLSFEMLTYKDVTVYKTCVECGTCRFNFVEKCITTFCNILLNNYSKIMSRDTAKQSKDKKIKKLSNV